ncbi:MAG: hypothetical protein JO270_02710 [Acidobacteriaceae bacterium]|nr:hypothetical protein [Acidobacteriaceae bacterium]
MTARTNFWLTAATAVVLQAIVLDFAYTEGITSKMIPWDECEYVFFGLVNVSELRSLGLSALPDLTFVHAPISYLQITSMLFLSGNRVSAPFLVNVLYVFLFLYAISRSLRSFGAAPVLAFWLMAVSLPLVFLFSSHLKADYLAGCFFFVMLVELFILDTPTARRLALGTVLACCTALSKPMAFYVPGLTGFAFAATLFRDAATGRLDWRRFSSLVPYVIAAIVPIGVFALIALPHLPYFVAYIKQALSPPWVGDFSWLERLGYYLPVPNSEELGWFGFWGRGFVCFILLVAVFVASAARVRVRRDDLITLLALVAVTGAAYVPIVASPQLQKPFGSIFAGSVLAVFLCAYRTLKRDMQRSYILDWGLIAAGIACFRLPVEVTQSVTPSSPQNIVEATTILRHFVSDMAAQNAPPNPSIYFSYGPIPYFDFGTWFYLNTGRFPYSMDEPLSDNKDEIRNGVRSADYVIVWDAKPSEGDSQWRTVMHTTANTILKIPNLQEADQLSFAGGRYLLFRVAKDRSTASRD